MASRELAFIVLKGSLTKKSALMQIRPLSAKELHGVAVQQEADEQGWFIVDFLPK